jgi:hypothetical protein
VGVLLLGGTRKGLFLIRGSGNEWKVGEPVLATELGG